MSAPPPPPPPAAPKAPSVSAAASKPPAASQDKGALLKQIQKGAKLKKAETNDRSAPIVDAPKASPAAASGGGGGSRPGAGGGSSGPTPQLGGLFAGGMPKLRPAGGNAVGGGKVNADTSVKPSTITPVPSKAPAAQSSFRPPMIPKPNDSVSNAPAKPLGKPPLKVPPPVPAISNATPSIGKNGPPLPGRRPSEIAALKSPTSSGPPPVPSIPKPTKSPTSSNENISGSVSVSDKIVMPKRGSVSAKLAPPVPGRPRSISTGSSEKINTSAGKLPPAVPNRPPQGNSRSNEKINDNDGSQKVSSPGQLRKQPPVPGGSVTKPSTLGRSPSIPLSYGPLSDDMDDGRYKFRPDSELPPPHAFTPSIKVYYSGAVTGSKYNIDSLLGIKANSPGTARRPQPSVPGRAPPPPPPRS